MSTRRKPQQKGSQPNVTTRSTRTRVSAALGAPPPAATMRLAFEEAEEMQEDPALSWGHGKHPQYMGDWGREPASSIRAYSQIDAWHVAVGEPC